MSSAQQLPENEGEKCSVAPHFSHTSIFHEQWWLEAAGGTDLAHVEVTWDGVTVGKLYFVKRKVGGLRLLSLPPYTRTLGPHLYLPPSKPETRAANLRRIVGALVDALPRHDRFHTYLDPRDPAAFAFSLAGCTIELDFTFRVDVHEKLDRLWAGLNPKTRNLVRTAARRLVIEESSEYEVFSELSRREHPRRNWHEFETLRRILRAAGERGQSTVHIARNQDGNVVASSVLIWDNELLYYWQSSRDPRLSEPGANSLLVWKAIELAHRKGLAFDFDGYHSLSEARFATRFGFTPVVRPSVLKLSTLGYIARRAASLAGRRFSMDKSAEKSRN